MDLEAGRYQHALRRNTWRGTLTLAYQSIGIVYGDLSITPLYVFKSSLSGIAEISDSDTEILGVLSLIFWTLTLISLAKYMLIVLKANDDGEGGTFALYSLLCRHTKLSHIRNRQDVDEFSTHNPEPTSKTRRKHHIIHFLEEHKLVHDVLIGIVLFGTCMVIGDGILTPPMSVLSAVSGVNIASNHLSEHLIVGIACIILVCLFTLQQFGTHRVAFMFAPIILIWLFFTSSIGIYNIFRWNPGIYKGLSPYYIFSFFHQTGKKGWISLGGVVLCITGLEAMFADLGHFSQSSIKLAFICVVYPCLILTYMGQAAFFSRNRREADWNFFKAVPQPLFWPVFVVATLASVIGSQAIISATFSIIKQSSALGFFPRVKIVHTSHSILGQIYIPEINWMLMILCLAITIGFRNTTLIGHAYGLAVTMVILVTTCLMTFIIIVEWHKNLFLAIGFFLLFGSVEAMYASSCLIKVHEGGWVPLVLALIFMVIMYIWHYGLKKKHEFDMENKVSMKWLLSLGPSLGFVRVRGMGLIYTELMSGVPAIFSHFVTNLPAFHQVVVFVCIKVLPVPHISADERFFLGRIGPKEYRIYRCMVRYGYRDVPEADIEFEDQLVVTMGEFIKCEAKAATASAEDGFTMEKMTVVRQSDHPILKLVPLQTSGAPQDEEDESKHGASTSEIDASSNGLHLPHRAQSSGRRKQVRFELPESTSLDESVKEELSEILQAKEMGVAYILGHSHLKANSSSSIFKKLAINVVFNFLRRNCRGPMAALGIPHTNLIEVGMIYHV